MDDRLRQAFDDRLLDLHTSQPGRIVTFYESTYEADIEIVCRRPVPHADGGFVYEDPPIVPRVLICALGNADSWLRIPLKKGDLVWLISPEISTDEFVDTGEVAQPQKVDRHGLLGSIAIPFLLPSKIPSGPLVSLGGTGAEALALAAKVDAAFTALIGAITTMAATGNAGGPLDFSPPTYPSIATTEVFGK